MTNGFQDEHRSGSEIGPRRWAMRRYRVPISVRLLGGSGQIAICLCIGFPFSVFRFSPPRLLAS
jgi:hypothetical protein